MEGTIFFIVVLILLLGGGDGYYGYNRFGGSGLGGALGLVLIVLIVVAGRRRAVQPPLTPRVRHRARAAILSSANQRVVLRSLEPRSSQNRATIP